jgi:hypothetical protein
MNKLKVLAWRCALAGWGGAGCAFVSMLDTAHNVAWMLAGLALLVISMIMAEKHQQVKYANY